MIRGNLDLLLLATLRSGPAHGYAIIEDLRTRSSGVLDFAEGTVYPALNRLAREGLLKDEWSEGTGRRRRVYHLTAKGEAALQIGREDYRRHAGAVNEILLGGGSC